MLDQSNELTESEVEAVEWWVTYLEGLNEKDLSAYAKEAYNILNDWGLISVNHLGLIEVLSRDLPIAPTKSAQSREAIYGPLNYL